MIDIAKQRYNRLAQQKHRGGKQSFVTQTENLKILLLWQAAEISEGQAAKALGMKRIEARELMYQAIVDAIELCDPLLAEKFHAQPDRARASGGSMRSVKMSTIHYSGGLSIRLKNGSRELLPGWAACSHGDTAFRIKDHGKQTRDKLSVTCKKCLELIEKERSAAPMTEV